MREASGLETPGGVYLSTVMPGEILVVRTQDKRYTIVYLGYGAAKISGSPPLGTGQRFVNILGSSCDTHGLLAGFVGIGMRLEFQAPDDSKVTQTTPIEDIARRGGAPEVAGDDRKRRVASVR